MSDSFDSSSDSSGSDSFTDSSSGSDSFTETTTEGWGSRLGNSLGAAVLGLILVPAAIWLLWFNEGRAVDAIRALNRGAGSVIEVSASPVDPAGNGKLVHVTGTLAPTTPAKDPVFGVTGDGLVRLTRTVEAYQWKEETSTKTTQNVGGSKTTEKTYNYVKEWSSQPIDSSHFKVPANHQNPPMPQKSATFDGGTVKIGALQVDPSVLDKINVFKPVRAESSPPSGYQASGDGFYQGPRPFRSRPRRRPEC
jgi:hypothetical protein